MTIDRARSQRGISGWARVTGGVCAAALLLSLPAGAAAARADGDYRSAAVQAQLVRTLPSDVKALWAAHPEIGQYFRGATPFMGGQLYEFSAGRIVKSTGRAPYLVDGPIGDYFMRSATVRSQLGVPISHPRAVSGGQEQVFAHGRAFWNAGRGTRAHAYGAMHNQWVSGGGLATYGLPRGNQTVALCGGGRAQAFEKRTITVRVDGRWCPASRYEQPTTRSAARSGYVAAYWQNGVKIKVLNRKFGLPDRWERYDDRLLRKVVAWKKARGLPANSYVNRSVWNAMRTGYSYDIDGWAPSVAMPMSATRVQRRDHMIRYATSRVGGTYTWGGTGDTGLGYDCSGLLLQAMRSAGVNPSTVSNWTNVRPASDLSHQMYHVGRFKKVPLAQRQPGDFIFWRLSSGRITHVGLYLGNGRTVEGWGTRIQYRSYSYYSDGRPAMPYVVRVFS